MRDRTTLLRHLRQTPQVPVLIIGGGINGVGILRDLAAQGVPALLVERGDICGGASAAPSRLIHGGLRYLETGEFGLVRESVHERELLLRHAPHLVRPIPTWVPLTSWTAGSLAAVGRVLGLIRNPGRKGAVPLKLGLILYDRFARATRQMPRHRFLSSTAARRTLPLLSRDVRVVAEYYDARVTHPERLTLELVADAEADCPGCAALPYVSAIRMEQTEVVLRDEVSGETLRVGPKLIVNAAGAWADQVDDGLRLNEKLMGGTKGSHLVLRAPALAAELDERMLYFETGDKRICLVYALDPAHVLLGTTDLPTSDPDDRTCSPQEIDYLFGALSVALPGHGLSASDIVFTYAGVRPLPRNDAGVAGAISRDHKLHRFAAAPGRPIPVLTLVGGKWTTYRACSRDVADAVLTELSLPHRVDTAFLPIGGGHDWPTGGAAALAARLVAQTNVTPQRAAILVRRYGSAAGAVLQGARQWIDGPPADPPLRAAPDYTRGEIAWLARQERVTRLDDMILRRTLMAFEGLAGRACVQEVGAVVAAALDWTADRQTEEVEATCRLLGTRHGVAGMMATTAVSEKEHAIP